MESHGFRLNPALIIDKGDAGPKSSAFAHDIHDANIDTSDAICGFSRRWQALPGCEGALEPTPGVDQHQASTGKARSDYEQDSPLPYAHDFSLPAVK
jgi:hypothetical protein